MNNLDIYNQVREVPEEAQKPINGGRLKGMTDINPMWRIKKLTEVFGMCGFGWYIEEKNKWIETVGNETCAFVDIALYVKQDGEWSKPIHGTGGSKLSTVEKSGVYVDDECYKKALTDAISVACKSLGFGADIYWQKDRTKYDSGETTNLQDLIGKIRLEQKKKNISDEQIEARYGNFEEMNIETAWRCLKALEKS